jgi:hypothetical protein
MLALDRANETRLAAVGYGQAAVAQGSTTPEEIRAYVLRFCGERAA